MPFLAALPPVLIASLIGGGASIGTSLLAGRKSEGVKSAESAATRQSEAETKSIEQRTGLIEQLMSSISSSQGQAPPIFEFGEAAGGPTGNADFYGQLRPMAGINMLMQLAGMGTVGTGATSGILNRESVDAGRRQGFAGDICSNITFIIAELLKARGSKGALDINTLGDPLSAQGQVA